MPAGARLSLAALLNAAVPIRVDDVSALIRRLSECSARMTVTPLEPSTEPLRPEYVWLYPDGSVQLLPGVVPTVRDLGALLEHLLGEIRSRGPARIPPGLVLVAARATGKIDWRRWYRRLRSRPRSSDSIPPTRPPQSVRCSKPESRRAPQWPPARYESIPLRVTLPRSLSNVQSPQPTRSSARRPTDSHAHRRAAGG